MIVVKLGGSLFDIPDLFVELRTYLEWTHPDDHPYLIVPGGGEAAEAVRTWQRVQAFDDATAHWLALRMMGVTARLLVRCLFPFAQLVAHPTAEPVAFIEGSEYRIRVLDAHEFCFNDDVLPHSWAVTSDSIAARAAIVAKATKLVLLKSVDIPLGTPWDVAAANGWVDDHFPTIATRLSCPAEVVNFRAWVTKFSEEA